MDNQLTLRGLPRRRTDHTRVGLPAITRKSGGFFLWNGKRSRLSKSGCAVVEGSSELDLAGFEIGDQEGLHGAVAAALTCPPLAGVQARKLYTDLFCDEIAPAGNERDLRCRHHRDKLDNASLGTAGTKVDDDSVEFVNHLS